MAARQRSWTAPNGSSPTNSCSTTWSHLCAPATLHLILTLAVALTLAGCGRRGARSWSSAFECLAQREGTARRPSAVPNDRSRDTRDPTPDISHRLSVDIP